MDVAFRLRLGGGGQVSRGKVSGKEDRVPGQGRCRCKGEWPQGAYGGLTRAEAGKTAHPDWGKLVSQVGDLGLSCEQQGAQCTSCPEGQAFRMVLLLPVGKTRPEGDRSRCGRSARRLSGLERSQPEPGR